MICALGPADRQVSAIRGYLTAHNDSLPWKWQDCAISAGWALARQITKLRVIRGGRRDAWGCSRTARGTRRKCTAHRKLFLPPTRLAGEGWGHPRGCGVAWVKPPDNPGEMQAARFPKESDGMRAEERPGWFRHPVHGWLPRLRETSARKQARKRFKRYLLDRQGGKCFWCERPIVIYEDVRGGRLPADAATRDHLDHRLSGERGKHPGRVRSVLACVGCNQQRGAEFVASLPVERVRELSGRHPELRGARPAYWLTAARGGEADAE